MALSCCVDHFLGSLCPLRGEGHCVALTDDDVNKQHMMMETVCPDGSGLFQNDITSTALNGNEYPLFGLSNSAKGYKRLKKSYRYCPSCLSIQC